MAAGGEPDAAAESGTGRVEDAEIARLAVPAFLALVSEPLFLLADSAIVGHLGTTALAGLGIAAAVLNTLVSLCVFLAYGTTAAVARRIGAGDPDGALRHGIDGVWLAIVIGAAVTVLGRLAAPGLIGLFGPSAAVADQARTYLDLAILGATPLLIGLAATGILRGLQDTRTPLLVAIAANGANIALNLWLVYGLDRGIAGSALGSVIAQSGAAVALLVVIGRAAHRRGVTFGPRWSGIRDAGRAGAALLLRTLSLRANLLVMTFGAARLGDPEIAAMQIALTVWTFLAFALDALAIAAQALTGRALGAGDAESTRRLTLRMLHWGLRAGLLTGLALALLAGVIGPLFTSDPVVRDLLVPVFLVAAAAQPLAGVVFVLDGILIGAGDGRYLARAGLLVLVAFVPAGLLAVAATGSLTMLWVSFVVVFMGSRAAVLLHRRRGTAWMTLG